MASVAMTVPANFPQLRNPKGTFGIIIFKLVLGLKAISHLVLPYRLLFRDGVGHRSFSQPISAVGSGLKAPFTDPKDSDITLKKAKIVVELRDDAKIQVRVDLTGEETKKIFDEVLTNLASSAPPISEFRKQKGVKTSKVPRSIIFQALGKDRVKEIVVQEIVSLTINDYVKKENLTLKNKKFSTTQTAKELEQRFASGSKFGFNAILELDKDEPQTTS